MACLIQDAQTLVFKVPARGPWPDMSFRYRRALYQALSENRMAPKDTAQKIVQETCRFIEKHVVSWDVTGPNKEMVPATADNIAKLPAPYIDEMYAAVTGYSVQEQEYDLKNSTPASA